MCAEALSSWVSVMGWPNEMAVLAVAVLAAVANFADFGKGLPFKAKLAVSTKESIYFLQELAEIGQIG
jgi:hypothetical protein